MSELPPHLSRDDAATLLERADAVAHSAQDELHYHYAQLIPAAAGLSVHLGTGQQRLQCRRRE